MLKGKEARDFCLRVRSAAVLFACCCVVACCSAVLSIPSGPLFSAPGQGSAQRQMHGSQLERGRGGRECKGKREGQLVEWTWSEEKQDRRGCMFRQEEEEDVGGAAEEYGAMCKGRVGERRGRGRIRGGGLLFSVQSLFFFDPSSGARVPFVC